MKKYIYLLLLVMVVVSCTKSSSDDTTLEENVPDYSCSPATSLFADELHINYFYASFNSNGSVERSDLEFGERGFAIGQGIKVENYYSQQGPIDANFKGLTDYEFYIKSYCADGTVVNSERKLFTTPSCPVVNIYDAINITETTATVRFSDNHFIESYEVEYSEEGFQLGTGITRLVTDQSIDLTDLSGGKSYDVYVKTNCGGLLGDYSEKFTFETLPLCYTPTNLRWTTVSSSSISISWNTEGESSWQIQYGFAGFPLGSGAIVNATARPHKFHGLQSGRSYEFYIRANCGGDGFSEWSDSLVVTTLDP